MKRKRLDDILIERGLAADKKNAFAVVTAGRVLVGGQKAVSPAMLVEPEAKIELRGERLYVGRGAYKLEAALNKFGINVQGKVCVDIGAATGGFTEVLLLHGAKKVYAIDTARGKLAFKLREDPRVTVVEGVDVRDLKKLPEAADIITADVSLISLRHVLSHLRNFLKEKGEVITLFKPQYETRDQKILKHGVVRDNTVREKLLKEFLGWAEENNWKVIDWMESPIRGDKGNVEYLIFLQHLFL